MNKKELNDIVREYVPKLHTFVRRRVDNNDDAEDIVQDTIYQFLRTIRVLENPIAHVSSWFYTVARNLIVNNGRKRHEESLPHAQNADGDTFMEDLSEIMMADSKDNPDMRMLRSMVWDELNKALSELPEEQRDAVLMTEIDGLSVKDASEKMGVSQNTFLSRKHYAIKHIRKRLQTLYNELLTQ